MGIASKNDCRLERKRMKKGMYDFPFLSLRGMWMGFKERGEQ